MPGQPASDSAGAGKQATHQSERLHQEQPGTGHQERQDAQHEVGCTQDGPHIMIEAAPQSPQDPCWLPRGVGQQLSCYAKFVCRLWSDLPPSAVD